MPKLYPFTIGLLLLFACTREKSEPSAQSAAEPLHAAAKPEAHPEAHAAPTDGKASAGGLTWTAEAPLIARTPKSRMRAAEYGLSGDPQAELSVFYFGPGQGGAVDANVQRWLGQFAQPDGSSTEKASQRSERKVGDVEVTTIETTGIYSGGMAMPGAPKPSAEEDAMLLGAIASGPEGPVFFKLVGKRASVEAARSAFNALLDSLRPAS